MANNFLFQHVKADSLFFLQDFKNLRFYASDGDEYDLEGGLVYLSQEAPDGEEVAGTKCTAMILKDSIFEEKC